MSDDLPDEAAKLMDCGPAAIAVGLTTDAGPGGPAKLAARCEEVAGLTGVPVCSVPPVRRDYAALRALGAQRIAVVTPFTAEIDAVVKANTEDAGFDVVAIRGTEAPSLPAICETQLSDILRVFGEMAAVDCDAILQVGTALPVVALIAELEAELGKPIVACNAAVYWQTLRAIGIADPIQGFGRLLAEH